MRSAASPDIVRAEGTTVSLLEPLAGGLGAVPGFRTAGVHAGLKKRKPDLALIAADGRRTVAACVTTNDVKAAPLIVSERNLTRSGRTARAVVCNSGCANACTGAEGMADAEETCRLAASELGCEPHEVVVASTGVIGERLDMRKICAGIGRAGAMLASGEAAAAHAARAIMTTDRHPKLSAYAFHADGRRYMVGAIAKGSGMIAPQLATMLAFVGTDAPVGAAALQEALSRACEQTFNMISVDGDMSTNDAVYALAAPCADRAFAPYGFREALEAVCRDLAVAIARDGEGATKLLQVTVSGAPDAAAARTMARAIVDSSLVKTAIYGADPNWGRIIAAAGSVRMGFPASGWRLLLNGAAWVVSGREFLSQSDANRLLAAGDTHLHVELGAGVASATAWGCDLTPEYVRINASYRT